MNEDNDVIVETFLTTFDNPFDPYTQFNEWNAYDIQLGYNTCALVDRVYQAWADSNEIDEVESEKLRNESIKRIVSLMPNVYKLIQNETFVDSIPMTKDDMDVDT